jgi:hypothetical protein
MVGSFPRFSLGARWCAPGSLDAARAERFPKFDEFAQNGLQKPNRISFGSLGAENSQWFSQTDYQGGFGARIVG